MKLSEIKHTNETATGVDSDNNIVIVEKAITYLYRRNYTEANNQIHFRALTFRAQAELEIIAKLLSGKQLSAYESKVAGEIHVRFGWISQDMLQLSWIPILELYENYLNAIQTPTEKNKFQQVCRVVAIPMRVLTVQRKQRMALKGN